MPGGSFAFAGKVAVVSDGLAYSAGDYFTRAVAVATTAPLVGAASAGGYGGGAAPISLDGPPALKVYGDPSGCFDAVTDQPLEASPPPPTVAVEYTPAEVAAGRDPVVDRAVLELGL